MWHDMLVSDAKQHECVTRASKFNGHGSRHADARKSEEQVLLRDVASQQGPKCRSSWFLRRDASLRTFQ